MTLRVAELIFSTLWRQNFCRVGAKTFCSNDAGGKTSTSGRCYKTFLEREIWTNVEWTWLDVNNFFLFKSQPQLMRRQDRMSSWQGWIRGPSRRVLHAGFLFPGGAAMHWPTALGVSPMPALLSPFLGWVAYFFALNVLVLLYYLNKIVTVIDVKFFIPSWVRRTECCCTEYA